jgi:hypothetical protein
MAQNIKPKAIPFRTTSPPGLSAKPHMRPGEAAKNNADIDGRWAIGSLVSNCRFKSGGRKSSWVASGCLTRALCVIETRLVLQALPVPYDRFGK